MIYAKNLSVGGNFFFLISRLKKQKKKGKNKIRKDEIKSGRQLEYKIFDVIPSIFLVNRS